MKSKKAPLLCLLVLYSLTLFRGHAAEPAPALPLLPPLFSDHAVLQRDVRVPVWGWAASGTKVTVAFAGQTKSTVAQPDGKWIIYLNPMQASAEPRTLTVSGAAANET